MYLRSWLMKARERVVRVAAFTRPFNRDRLLNPNLFLHKFTPRLISKIHLWGGLSLELITWQCPLFNFSRCRRWILVP